MLIYLLFIFTCGWCVCWLLFLNYQQHTRDSERLQHRRAFTGGGGGGHECLRRLRRRLVGSSSKAVRDQQDAAEAGESEIYQQQQHQVVVDEDGEHSLLVNSDELDDECGTVDEFSYYLEEYAPAADNSPIDLFSTGEPQSRAVDLCDHCQQQQQSTLNIDAASASHLHLVSDDDGLLRGWPEDLMSSMPDEDEEEEEGEEAEDDGEHDDELTLWPIVELHENPLNSISFGVSDAMRAHNGAGDVSSSSVGVEGLGEEETNIQLTDRSRLLSLQASQQQNRAAIRMVSS